MRHAGLVLIGWLSGDNRDLLSRSANLFFFASWLILYGCTWGKIDVRERGILTGWGFWPWSRVRSHNWESTEAGIAILKLTGPSQLLAWFWRPKQIAIPISQKEAVEGILERQLGQWPNSPPSSVESGSRDARLGSQPRSSRTDWLIVGVSFIPILFLLVRIVGIDFATAGRRIPSAYSKQGNWISISSSERAAQIAQEAVVQFHDLFSRAQYDKLCSIFEPNAHQPGLPCEEYLEWRRVRLGPFKYTNQTSFAGRYNGKLTQVELRYATRYENGEGVEGFTWYIREGRATLASYGVVSDVFSK